MRRLVVLFVFVSCTLFAGPKQLLVLGQKPDGHPPGTHEYMPGAGVVAALMELFTGQRDLNCLRSAKHWMAVKLVMQN